MPQELKDAIVSLRMDEAVTLAKRMVADGTDPLAIIAEGSEAMQVIGRRFADGEAFIPELIMGGEIMKARLAGSAAGGRRARTRRARRARSSSARSTATSTTSARTSWRSCSGIGGYTVHDLGTDVPVEDFVAAVKEHDADIVALSGLLTLAFDAMKSTVDGIAAAGLRDTGQDHDRRRRRSTRTCARTRGPTAGATTWVTPSSSPTSGPTEAPDAARRRGEARGPPHRGLGERGAPAVRERRGQGEVPGQGPAHRRHHPARGHGQDPGHPRRHPEVRPRLRSA